VAVEVDGRLCGLAGDDDAGADDAEPLFLSPDQTRPATPRHIHNWLERIGRETGLRFDATIGWNRYATPPWATFHELAAAALIAR
jgi:hypothetical protein